MYDLVIIGGGPAGVAAGIYAARKRMKTILVTDTFGGQSLVSADIQNWVGTRSISGFDLAKLFEEHLKAQTGIEIVEDERIEEVAAAGTDGGKPVFSVRTGTGREFRTKSVLVASGSRRRRLGVPGEDAFDGKGVVFCTTCDAPLFKGKTVAVIGGGNSGLESVMDLTVYAEKIFLLHRKPTLKGDQLTQEKITADPKVTIIVQAEVQEIKGEAMVTGLRYLDTATGSMKTLDVQGVFVEIGSMPNSEIVQGLVKRNTWGEIEVDHRTQRTSCPGVWAAGDVTDLPYRQNNISVGDAIKAVLNINDYLRSA